MSSPQKSCQELLEFCWRKEGIFLSEEKYQLSLVQKGGQRIVVEAELKIEDSRRNILERFQNIIGDMKIMLVNTLYMTKDNFNM